MSSSSLLRRTLSIAALAAVLGVIGAAAAGAQGSTLDVSPATVAAGGTVTISGIVPMSGESSCPESDLATLTSDAALFPPDGFGPDVTRDSSGAFQLTYIVDAATPSGVHEIGVRCGGGNVGISASLEVTPHAVPSTAAPSSTTNAVVTTAPPVVIATAVVVSPESTVASADDGGGGIRWRIVAVLVAALIAVVLVAWRGRQSVK